MRPALGVVVAVALVALFLPATAGPGSVAAQTAGSGEGCAGTARLSDPQLVAQVLGAPLRTPTMTPEVADLAAQRVGTVVLLGDAIQSAAQVDALLADLDAVAPAGLPPIVAVDEEGGRVARFGRGGVATHLPSARSQAAAGSPEAVRDAAAGLGAQLAARGVDLNLAPVLDLSAAEAGTIIGDRSFSADPALAGAYGGAFAEGMRQSGVRTSAKHFPDHGLTTTDTHSSVVVVDVTVEALRGAHLEPYRIALPHLDSIMLSHLRIPALDPDLPVSLSPAAVAFLRAELAFDGVVVTDDLSMQAVAAVADQPTAALLAIRAGADLALAGTVEGAGAAHERLLAALDTGELPSSRLREAVVRVLRLRGVTPGQIACMVGPMHYSRSR